MSEQPEMEPVVEEPFAPIELLVEFPDSPGMVKASRKSRLDELKAESQTALNMAMGVMHSMAYRMNRTIDKIDQKVRPDEIEVEFSLKMELEGGTVLPMVAQTTVGGQFNFKFTWKLDRPGEAKVLVSQTP